VCQIMFLFVLTALSADVLKSVVGVAEDFAVFCASMNSIICDSCMVEEIGNLVVDLYV